MSGYSEGLKRHLKAAAGVGARSLPGLRRRCVSGLTVFVFHDVTDAPSRFAKDYGLAVSTELFAAQISWITRNFQVVHPLAPLAEALPEKAALITFDDGFHGTFANGLEFLAGMKLPAAVFLNMRSVMQGRPLLSAVACYLAACAPGFDDFARAGGIPRPFHLTFSPEIVDRISREFGPVDPAAVAEYQGRFADEAMLQVHADPDLVVYGNHLYEHWNSLALTPAEFTEQYVRNRTALAGFRNAAEIFAFPNGHPNTCFAQAHVALLAELGARQVFTAAGGKNHDPRGFLLGRMALGPDDNSDALLWGRLARATVSRGPALK